MKVHPIANIFPDMDDDEYRDLVEDIRKNGLREPVWVDQDGTLIDGRHRVSACAEIGIDCPQRVYEGDDIVGFVVSLNLHRRHMTQSQVANSAARAKSYWDEQAKARLRAGQQRGRDVQRGTVAPGPHTPPRRSRDEVGEVFGVSGRSVARAEKVIREGAPELVAAVDSGKISLKTAERALKEPVEVQVAIATEPRRKQPKPVEPKPEPGDITVKGVGVFRANEAINCLQRIPKNDALRARGFQIVSDWIRHNK